MRRAFSRALVIFFAGAVVVAGCKNPLLSGAILHFDQKRYERAREALLNAIQQEPGNAEAYLMLGQTYAELDSTLLARENLERASDLAGDRRPEIKDKAINALDHYWSEHHNRGLSLAKASQDALGKVEFETDEKVKEGLREEAQRSFRLSLNQFKRARIYNSTMEQTPRNMGTVYFNLGEVDSGLVVLKESQKLAPEGDERAAGLLFNQYRGLGDKAVSQGTDSDEPDAESLSDAVRFYTEAEKLKPTDTDLLFSIGVVYYQLAQADSGRAEEYYAGAIEYFEKTLKEDPDDQEALYNAASLHLELATCQDGLDQAKHLLDLDPRQGRFHDLLGRLLDCLGEKTQRVAGLVFSRALTSAAQMPLENFRENLEAQGAQSDLIRKYREEGIPEEVRSFSDGSGGEYVTWFYWSRGKAYAFYNGEKKYETIFKPQQPTEDAGSE